MVAAYEKQGPRLSKFSWSNFEVFSFFTGGQTDVDIEMLHEECIRWKKELLWSG